MCRWRCIGDADLTQIGFTASIDKGPWTWRRSGPRLRNIGSSRDTGFGIAGASYDRGSTAR